MKDNLKTDVVENKHKILHNKHRIEQNKEAIHEIKQGCQTRCVPQEIFMEYATLTRRLILALCIVIALLFVTNIIWVVAWSAKPSITSGGNANVIGNDGGIINGQD